MLTIMSSLSSTFQQVDCSVQKLSTSSVQKAEKSDLGEAQPCEKIVTAEHAT